MSEPQNHLRPAFSVVIPLYNKEKSVVRCLASVRAQTWPATEIIVVNDGSTDGSRTAAASVVDSRIKLMDQPNGGVSSARNLGLLQAQCEYVALLDADDEWNPDFLETMAALIREFPASGLYYAAHVNWFGPEKVLTTAVPDLSSDYCGLVNIFKLNTDAGPWSSAVVIHKPKLEQVGLFDANLAKGEDIDLWIRFALHGPIIFCNRPLAICHQEAENRAMNRPTHPERSLVNQLDRFAQLANQNPDLFKYLRRMRLAHLCNFLGGRNCELADGHREINRLDTRGLPRFWRIIQISPPAARSLVFRLGLRLWRLYSRLTGVPVTLFDS